MPRLTSTSAIALAAASAAAWSQPQPQSSPKVLARAIGEAPRPEVVRFIASQAEPIRYDARHRPDLAGKSFDEAIKEQCGSVQDGYKEALIDLNPGAEIPATGPIGTLAYRLHWPACLHVASKPRISYIVRPGDTKTSIRQKFTGSGGYLPEEITSFFASSNIPQGTKLQPGDKIEVPIATSYTLITPRAMSSQDFAATIEAFSDQNVKASADPEAPGSIVGPVRFRNAGTSTGSIQGTFDPCNGGNAADGYPYDASEVANAFQWMRQGDLARHLGLVTVVVVDNGFFGVPCLAPNDCAKIVNDRVRESSFFPHKLFDTVAFNDRAGFGPELKLKPVKALNYWNRKPDNDYFTAADVNEISGHGTHVAGLAVGGPPFVIHRPLFVGSDDKYWLRLVVANLANGQRDMVAGTDLALGDILGEIDGLKIVNMSVAYNAVPGSTVGNSIKAAIVGDVHSLFIVAAGNDGGSLNDDNHDLYPANLGGAKHQNVITVASVDAPSGGRIRLSAFSNRSRDYVDLAAPGCRISSWIDGDRDPVEVSGTSQATPIVSFGAAMLAALWPTTPERLKNRLLYSGDLLDDAADRAAIRSHSRLNIAKALTYTLDRVTFRRAEATRTLLGSLDEVQNLSCEDGAKIAPAYLKAIKRSQDGQVYFYRQRGAEGLSICPGSFAPASSLSFEPLAEVKNGRIETADPLGEPIQPNETIEIVMRK